ncbi:prolyl oligopeptidase [Syncephalis pseudoplumigaleata]|uniref:Prolyl endopeptidase n=1 Tax=Syncephalis pseudoplumigaleata TaxID=1712513 RepID=A0A4P9YWB5_9FUNG|nr:prolyl oligopeptidase [Syncephalis pseudoplumigaleata]|eukprot:RKP24138.1 prolyl oligopeptidase [Syncephalis pseudoplumigaleata]
MPRRPAACPSTASSSVVSALPSTDPAAPSAGTSAASQQQQHWPYPAARRDDSIVDTLHGQRIADPYRWLENANSTETKAFVEAENKVAMDYLKQDSKREAYKQTAGQLWDQEMVQYIRKKPNYYFTSIYSRGNNNHHAIYRHKTLNGKKELFLNMDMPSHHGFFYAGYSVHSPSGKFLAYAADTNSGETTIRVRCAENVEGLCKDKGPTADMVQGNINSRITWTHDDRGFFYTQSVKPSDRQASSDANAGPGNALYYHRLGTQQSQDQLISLPPEAEGRISTVDLSSDGNWLMLYFLDDNDIAPLWVTPMGQASKGVPQKPSFLRLIDTSNFGYTYIATHGSRFYFLINEYKSQSRVVAYDTNAPNDGLVDVFTAKDGHEIIGAYAFARNYMLIEYVQKGISTLAVHKMCTGKHVRDIPLLPGSIKSIWGQPEDGELFFGHSTLLSPQTVYRYDFASNALSTISEAKLPGFDASAFEVRQVSVAGKNGASFPMTIVARKGIQLDGSHPTLISALPRNGPTFALWFSHTGGAFMKHFRGVYAVLHIDIGSFDEDTSDKKNDQHPFQRSIDNIKSASAYLVQHNYTKPALLTAYGMNAEGTAVAAAVNQAPDQFGCALIERGIMDLPRLSQQSSAASLYSTLGNPEEKEDFDHMLKYSPLQNINGNRTYPAMLFTTDQETNYKSPWHPYKMVAELQHKLPNNPRPLMLRAEGSPDDNPNEWLELRAAEKADELAFIATSLGLKQNA